MEQTISTLYTSLGARLVSVPTMAKCCWCYHRKTKIPLIESFLTAQHNTPFGIWHSPLRLQSNRRPVKFGLGRVASCISPTAVDARTCVGRFVSCSSATFVFLTTRRMLELFACFACLFLDRQQAHVGGQVG